MVGAAGISPDDTVLEVGTGRGILVPYLCRSAKRVVSVEADPGLYADAKSRLFFDNLDLVMGDGFETDTEFSVFVSSLPYSESRAAVRWLCQRRFSRAVVMVQKEFADKLLLAAAPTAAPGRGDGGIGRAVSVIANHCFDIRQVLRVGRGNFTPPPRVDSVVLRLDQRHVLHPGVVGAVDRLFSYRRKTVPGILRMLGVQGGMPPQPPTPTAPPKRLDDLSVREIIKIARCVATG